MWRRHPTAVIGGVLLALIVAAAVFAPWLWTVDPHGAQPGASGCVRRARTSGSAPTWSGRDIYSRVLYGTRVSLLVGFSVAILSTAVGLVIGLGRRVQPLSSTPS